MQTSAGGMALFQMDVEAHVADDMFEMHVDDGIIGPKRRVRQKTRDPYCVPPPPQVVRRRTDVLAEHIGLMGAELRRLLSWGLPAFFFNMIAVICRGSVIGRDLDCVEMFSGKQTIVTAFNDAGYVAVGYDYLYDKAAMNLNSVLGWLTALILCLRLKCKSLQWWATVCSTWVWMSRSSTFRSARNPLGDLRLSCVVLANAQVARMTLLSLLASSRGASWALEQPSSSVMNRTPHLKMLEKLCPRFALGAWREFYTEMGAFGACTKKPTKIWSYGNTFMGLQRLASREFKARRTPATVTQGKHGKKSVTGTADLKLTQAYTPQFGRVVLRCWETEHELSHERFHEQDDAPTDIEIDFGENELWKHADLGNACKHLKVPQTKLIFNL